MRRIDQEPQVSSLVPRQTTGIAIEKLLLEAQPHIKRRLKQKGLEGENLEDLCAEATERFLKALQRRDEQDKIEMAYPARYALSVTDTVFDDYLRRLRPNWCRLKRRILYLLDATKATNRFRRWKFRTQWIAGFVRWIDHPFKPNARYHALCVRPATFCKMELGVLSPQELPLERLLAHLFHWLGTPLELDDLTSRIAQLQNIQDSTTLSIEDLASQTEVDEDHWTPASEANVESEVLDAIENDSFCDSLRDLLAVLPVRQRNALLLGMSTDELLLIAPIGSIAQILEMQREQLKKFWADLPLNDNEIASLLEITPKQVSNLRKCARERIERNLKARAKREVEAR